jgi:enoyl-CoA hydratase/carnithine racemase
MALTLSNVDGFVGTITLNYPEKRNALSESICPARPTLSA